MFDQKTTAASKLSPDAHSLLEIMASGAEVRMEFEGASCRLRIIQPGGQPMPTTWGMLRALDELSRTGYLTQANGYDGAARYQLSPDGYTAACA
jgi:hypothetical protein